MELKSPQTENPPSPSNNNNSTEFNPSSFTLTDSELTGLYNMIDKKMSQMIPTYHRIISNLKNSGMENPNPALVGMFFNNIRREQTS